ncbi:glycosyltransferase [Corynebacterium hansenii]|uniref:Glycosyltransferase n=1 Tax=Corynebacterium hansenii TaxID=394964 RepID=A0ABV7ZL37_9CORY|nr:glycosyltransferase [Corynebacterium hansenii]WJY98886.1 UDP-Gal:alpha-D-GlcNAc-diphosphoundecaprenol beta-1,3-galactosyltransferase [Corynebacterium hansenii]
MSTTRDDLAVLMTVYHRVDPSHLDAALESLWAQTVRAGRVVLVGDGPLTPDLDAVIARHAAAHPELDFRPQPENLGAGPASQAGLGLIDEEWCARLDTDDIAEPERFKKQLAVVDGPGPVPDVVGTAMAEFDDDLGGDITGIRALPESHDEIAKYARINSPFNHPSVLFRTERVKKVGGYRHAPYMEDYDLWARMLADGARFANLPEPLTRFRVTGMLDRRRAKGIVASERRMQATLVDLGLVSRPRAAFNFAARSAFRALPTGLLRRAYRALFHRRARSR